MPTDALTNLSLEQLRRAVSIKERIEALQAELSGSLGRRLNTPTDTRVGRKRSPAARARMAAAQRARWAKVKKRPATPASAPKRKIKFSAAAIARISAAAKARWAKAKAAGKKRLG